MPEVPALLRKRIPYDAEAVAWHFSRLDRNRTEAVRAAFLEYITPNLLRAIESKRTFRDYRVSPYVAMATAGSLALQDGRRLAEYLVGLKLYMGLETSFGKSIESEIVPLYPLDAEQGSYWDDPVEKYEEFASYAGLGRAAKQQARNNSVWREIDKACVVDGRRQLLTIKSGTSTINDSQVDAMTNAIANRAEAWLGSSKERYGVSGADIVIGLTYGTGAQTNNKDLQILNKLLARGFDLVDDSAGILGARGGELTVRRVVGADFWAYVASPAEPAAAEATYLEVLTGLALALREVQQDGVIGRAKAEAVDALFLDMADIDLRDDDVPRWIGDLSGTAEGAWLAAAVTGFYD